ncbi:endonuclease/exonuclease/phosphatase family protein [Hyalangium gracile]|uniref:endonuclease/exonuclease/phosphatase family protein n=1 Tax=Hyalangium gracile TaxID=394092 RepID=UPI001CCE0E2A|nr:endonuclease/exonuclease/phosphatase family protein [Hyalangium gracile]
MRLASLIPLALLATTLACATTAQPGHAAGARAPEEARESGHLRLMTYNIKSATRGLDDVVEVIRSARPDIVALQEVDCRSRRAGRLDQAAVLAERVGLSYHGHFRTRDMYGGAYGIALLSRFPVESLAQYALPVNEGGEPRTVVHAVLRVEGREVSVYLTHLIHSPFRSRIRLRQGVLIAGLLERDSRPRILMGDFNDGPDSLTVRLLRRRMVDVFDASGSGPSGTFQLPLPFLPSVRIDYVLASDAFTPLASRVPRVEASDHYPVIADVRLEQAPDGGPGVSASK